MDTHKKTTLFALHRWSNPACLHDYPFIAVAEDRSVFMSLGDHGLCFEWSLSDDIASSLAHDFAPTGERIRCDFSILRHLFDTVFAGGIRSGLVRFDLELQPKLLELSLPAQVMAEDGPEYLIQGLRAYQRLYREPVRVGVVTIAERAMLDVCASTFAEFGAQHGALLREPLPPRFRASSSEASLSKKKWDPGRGES